MLFIILHDVFYYETVSFGGMNEKNPNRIYILLIILFLFAASLMSACNQDGNSNVSEPTATPEPSMPDLGKFVAVVPKSDDTDYSIGNEEVKQKIIETIAAEKGVLLDIEIIEISKDNFTNELNTLLSQATQIDCIVADYDMLETYASVPGLFQPIDSLLNSYGTNLLNAIDASYWEDVKYNNEIYGIPSMPYPEQSIMMARSDMMYMFTTEPINSYSSLVALCNFYQKIGYEYPIAATWDQLIDIFALSYSTLPSDYGHTSSQNAFIMREQSGSYIKSFVPAIKALYDNGFLHPDFFTATEDQMKAEFMSGRSAIYIAEYDTIYSDRDMLRSTFPDGIMQLITPLYTSNHKSFVLSGEEKIDNVLMFTASGQNSQALMTYLDWAYTSQLNHTMTELGAYGSQILYNPALNEYEYMGTYTVDNKPYNGLYTLGLSTDMLYTPPTHKEYSLEIIAENTLQKDIHAYLSQSQYQFSVTVPISETAQSAMIQYQGIMRTATDLYIKGEIDIDQYNAYDRECRNNGLLTTLAQEIGVAYLYEIGVLE